MCDSHVYSFFSVHSEKEGDRLVTINVNSFPNSNPIMVQLIIIDYNQKYYELFSFHLFLILFGE